MTVPEWLSKRDGSLKPTLRNHSAYVLIGGAPQYRVETRPANGKYICSVQQSNNGHRLDDGTTYESAEAAFLGGLEQLRGKLGW